jgi:hypothetical protein
MLPMIPDIAYARHDAETFAAELRTATSNRVEFPFCEGASPERIDETLRIAKLNTPAGWNVRIEQTPKPAEVVAQQRADSTLSLPFELVGGGSVLDFSGFVKLNEVKLVAVRQ